MSESFLQEYFIESCPDFSQSSKIGRAGGSLISRELIVDYDNSGNGFDEIVRTSNERVLRGGF